ncbi:MAG: carboxymuconolactone decarboxylase family protein [Microthrixaceae bacterium]|nr:carboxymuconolactone decarboxylase family protein [Microthrixaceae bacterium]
MQQRLNMYELAPDAYEAILGLENYARSKVDPTLFELIKTRASMINGCAFCVDMHTTDALAQGEDIRRIVALSAWRESSFFTDVERSVLALTDAVTRLGEEGVTDDVWNTARMHFGDSELTDLVMAIVAINVWNRLAVTSHQATPPLKPRD